MLSLRAKQRCCLLQRTNKQRVSVVRPKAMPDTGVLADYLETYLTYVCKEGASSCLDQMVVPPPEEQLRVMQGLFDVSTKVDMQGLDGVFMKLLIMHDQDAVDTLVQSLQMHMASEQIINSIIRYSYEIPLDVSKNDVCL